MNSQEREDIEAIVNIGTSFHKLGVNAYRLESALTELTLKKGLIGQFFFTPTIIMATFHSKLSEVAKQVRIEPGAIDLGRLCHVDVLAHNYLLGKITSANLVTELKQVEESQELYPKYARLYSFGLSSAGISLIFAPTLPNLIGSFILGLAVGFLDMASKKFHKIAQLMDALAAFTLAIMGHFIQSIIPGAQSDIIILAGLIKLLPGLTLTVAMAELAMNHLASGTARFMGGMMSLLKLTFGLILANRILLFLPNRLDIHFFNNSNFMQNLNIELSDWMILPGLLTYALSTVVIYKANPKDTWAVFGAGMVGAFSAKMGVLFLGADIGAFVGGLTIGALSNFFSNKLSKPVGLFLWPGILIMVPGSFGLKGLEALFIHNYDIGIAAMVSTFAVAISLVAGLFFGNLVVSPRRSV